MSIRHRWLRRKGSEVHYEGELQPIDVWEIWGLDPWRANLLKYVYRWDKKGRIKDLVKALWYLVDYVNMLYDTGKLEMDKEMYAMWGQVAGVVVKMMGYMKTNCSNCEKEKDKGKDEERESREEARVVEGMRKEREFYMHNRVYKIPDREPVTFHDVTNGMVRVVQGGEVKQREWVASIYDWEGE